MSRQELMEAAYARKYRELYDRHWWWRAREVHVLRRLRRLALEPAAKILDVGCGDGLMWSRLQDYGEIEGIEPDARLVAPDSPWRSRIETADLLAGRPREAGYDLALMLDVLEHIEDDSAALERIRSLLAAGGHLVLTVPALRLLWSEFDVMNGHHRRYTKKALRAALEGAGLEVVSLRYCYFWTVLPLLARRAFFHRSEAEDSRFLEIPPRPVNRLLYALSLLDHRLTDLVPAPFGSSILAVARKGP